METLHRLWNTTEAKTLIENLQTGEALVKTEKMEVAKKVKMESKFWGKTQWVDQL